VQREERPVAPPGPGRSPGPPAPAFWLRLAAAPRRSKGSRARPLRGGGGGSGGGGGLSRRRWRARRRRAGWGRRRGRASRRAGPPAGDPTCGPGRPHRVRVGEQRRVEPIEDGVEVGHRGDAGHVVTDPGADRVAGEVPAGVLAEAGAAGPLALPAARRPRWSRMTSTTVPSGGGSCTRRPAKASARSRNSHGRPRQPRPTTTPAQPVRSIMASASWASQMSPLPSTGMVRTSSTRRRWRPSRRAGVALLGGAGVQRHRGGALGLGDAAGLEVGEQVVAHAGAELHRHRHRAGGVDGGGDDGPQQGAADRQGGAAALAGHLRDRAAEVHVDVVDAVLGHQDAHGLADGAGVDAVELHRADGLVAPRAQHGEGLAVALHQRPGGDHLAHVEPGPEAGAQRPERGVGDPGHGGEHHRRVDGQRPDAQRRSTPHARVPDRRGGADGGHGRRPGRHGQSSTTEMPSSASSRRMVGRDRPITLLGSPSMPSTNGADRPSRVKPPATPSGSPLPR
jgi:hypothetical protein